MAIHEVRMPQLGETVAEGTLAAWHKQPGDTVELREVIADIETDKVETEIESTVAGTVTRLLVDPGESVEVGTVLAEVETTSESADDDGEPATAEEQPASRPPSRAPSPQQEDAQRSYSGSDLKLSPLVRRLVGEHGIDLEDLAAFVQGSRVDRRVVESYLAQREPEGEGNRQDAAPSGDSAHGLQPFSRVRRTVARRMVESVQTSPHVATAIEVDLESVARLRQRIREQEPAGGRRLTWLPFIVASVARVLPRHERLNASVVDDGIEVHPTTDLGIAVDLDGDGLMVPVLREADGKDLWAIAAEMDDLAKRARGGDLAPKEASGSTFTISAQGPHGTLFTTAIINQPEVAILSVDGIKRRPVVIEAGDGTPVVVAHQTCVLTLSWDHRAIDGMYAGAFLAALRDDLQERDWGAEVG